MPIPRLLGAPVRIRYAPPVDRGVAAPPRPAIDQSPATHARLMEGVARGDAEKRTGLVHPQVSAALREGAPMVVVHTHSTDVVTGPAQPGIQALVQAHPEARIVALSSDAAAMGNRQPWLSARGFFSPEIRQALAGIGSQVYTGGNLAACLGRAIAQGAAGHQPGQPPKRLTVALDATYNAVAEPWNQMLMSLQNELIRENVRSYSLSVNGVDVLRVGAGPLQAQIAMWGQHPSPFNAPGRVG